MLIINKLLTSLPQQEYQSLIEELEEVQLTSGQIIYEPHEDIQFVYFPNKAMISLVSIMENGATTEVGLIGTEGMVGLPVIFQGNHSIYRAIVQIPGNSMRLRADVLRKEFQKGGKLQDLLLLYTQARLTQISQSAACNRQHLTEQRLARWLLSVHDCVLEDELPLTQEFIANMLGIRRSGVTIAASQLQEAEIIRYSRGKITILDYEKLEARACECYRLVQNEFMRLLGFPRG